MAKTFSKNPGPDEGTRRVSCNLCGGNAVSSHYSLPGASWVRCRRCGLVFQDPQPAPPDVGLRYDREYFEYEKQNEQAFYELARLGLEDIGFENRAGEVRSLGPFLDIGCATGLLLHRLAREGWNVEGLEICQESAEFASRRGGFPVHREPLENLTLPGNHYGAVHLSHVIEHLNDPLDFCRRVHGILKPGGLFIVTTPNRRGFQSLLFGKKWRSAIPDHLFLYDPRTLRKTAEKAGFRVLRMKTWGGLAAGAGPAALKKILDRGVKKLHWGDVMIFLFEKP